MKKHTGLYVLGAVVAAGVLLKGRVVRAVDMAKARMAAKTAGDVGAGATSDAIAQGAKSTPRIDPSTAKEEPLAYDVAAVIAAACSESPNDEPQRIADNIISAAQGVNPMDRNMPSVTINGSIVIGPDPQTPITDSVGNDVTNNNGSPMRAGHLASISQGLPKQDYQTNAQVYQEATGFPMGSSRTNSLVLADRASFVLKAVAVACPQCSASQIAGCVTDTANAHPTYTPHLLADNAAKAAQALTKSIPHPVLSLLKAPSRAMSSVLDAMNAQPSPAPAAKSPFLSSVFTPPSSAPSPDLLPVAPRDPGFAQLQPGYSPASDTTSATDIYTDGQGNYFLADGTPIDPSMLSQDEQGNVYLTMPDPNSPAASDPNTIYTDDQGNYFLADGTQIDPAMLQTAGFVKPPPKSLPKDDPPPKKDPDAWGEDF